MSRSPKTCSCCDGEAGAFDQHWNRDAGFGLCERCIDFVARGQTPADFERTYGLPGKHYARAPSAGILLTVRR